MGIWYFHTSTGVWVHFDLETYEDWLKTQKENTNEYT